MVQSESNNTTVGSAAKPASAHIAPPARKFTVEILVGIFTLASVICAGVLAVGIGNETLFGSDETAIYAEFDNISGLQKGASVEIGGVPIGRVESIELKDPVARVLLKIEKGVEIRDDDIAMIRTKGIIGDRYVKISRGGSSKFVPHGGTITETESVVDIEDIIGKIVHSMTGEKSDNDKK